MAYQKIARVRPTSKGTWDSTASYEILDIVTSLDGARAYIAAQDVPPNIDINNENYWNPIIDVSSAINTANAAAQTIDNKINDVSAQIDSIKQDVEQYYDNVKVDGLLYEDNKLYLTSKGEIVSDPVEVVGGSGGGGGSVTKIKLTNTTGATTLTIPNGDKAILSFNFISTEDDEPTGDGSLKITVNGVQKVSKTIPQGEQSIDVTEFLAVGSNNVRITCSDIYGMSRSIQITILVVELTISSTFDDTILYNEDISFRCTPYGSFEKTIHILVDEKEIITDTVNSSGRQYSATISRLPHGVHRLEVYTTANVQGTPLESNHLVYDILAVESNNTNILIASPFVVKTVMQGEQLSIPFSVYNPVNSETDIVLTYYTIANGARKIIQEYSRRVGQTRQTWNIRPKNVGTVYFEIATKDKHVFVVHKVEVEALQIDIEPITTNLAFALSAAGRANTEDNPAVWENNDITTTFTNVNWSSAGWATDDLGDTALRLIGDARAVVNYQPFYEDLRIYGKTIEIEFAIRDVNNRDAVIFSCLDKRAGSKIGIYATADAAYLNSESSSIKCQYKENEKIRLSFTVESRAEYRMLSMYLNGVLSAVTQYPESDNFTQIEPANIEFGSSYCGVDIYNIRVYNKALSETEIVDNFIADTTDIVELMKIYDRNNIYDEYDRLNYESLKPQIPIMTIIGELPKAKKDKKNVVIDYEDPFHPELNFTDDCVIDVQGTSSAGYVRKNWKLKFPNEHQHDLTQLPAKVFCMKVDYAEATGTHNTQNANFIETLYSELFPAKQDNPKVRSTIYGFPCLIFHQVDTTSDKIFYGKANFNFDKGAEAVYGFTEDYDVESWEFLNNTSDACNFKANIASVFPKSQNGWETDFEARYPDGTEDISNLRRIHDWVVSTNGNVEKFRTEFEQYFDKHFSLIYYVYTFFALMVDQRAKNMFLTIWNGKAYPYFYDNDTSYGINNEGLLVFDYYHEDTDVVDGSNVYNGQGSVLWNNFRMAFPDEIQQTYQQLRSTGKLTYDKLINQFITLGSDKWSESIYNEDSDFKYISMLRENNDASNLYQVRGDGELHLKYFLQNRLDYCDSKWQAADYIADQLFFRIYTPVDPETIEDPVLKEKTTKTIAAVPPNANISIIPYSNIYAGVKYTANRAIEQQKVKKNELFTFIAPSETFNDTETYIYGASKISSLVDLAPLYCGTINVSKATKLINLKIGDSNPDYYNANLKDLQIGANRLLKTLDVRNCVALTQPLALSGCSNIEEVYAEGTAITSVELPESGYLKTIHLPNTITNLTIKKQHYITDFQLTPINLSTLRIEDTPLDIPSLINGAPNLQRIRIIDGKWEMESEEELLAFLTKLKTFKGIQEDGTNSDTPVVTGRVEIPSISRQGLERVNELFPELIVTNNGIGLFIVRYLNYDGTVLTRVRVNEGEAAPDPVKSGLIQTPYRPSIDAESYGYTDFGDLSTSVSSNLTYVANYETSYRIRFFHGMQEITTYGHWSIYKKKGERIDVPTETAQNFQTIDKVYTFKNWIWKDRYNSVEGPEDIYAEYTSSPRYYDVTFYNDDYVTVLYRDSVPYGGNAVFYRDETAPTLTSTINGYGSFKEWSGSLNNIIGNTLLYAVYNTNINNVEITADWNTVIADCASGEYKTKYKIGQYKPIDLGSEGIINMQIAEVDTDNLADGGKAPLTWIAKETLLTKRKFNPDLITERAGDEREAWIYDSAKQAWYSNIKGIDSTSCVGLWRINTTDESAKIVVSAQSSCEGGYYDSLFTQYGKTIQDGALIDGQNLFPTLTGVMEKWETETFTLTTNNPIYISASYSKDVSQSGGDDCGYLKFEPEGNVEITYLSSPIEVSWITGYQEGTGGIGGWELSSLRAYLTDTLYKSMPTTLKNGIKTVVKTSNSQSKDSPSLTSIKTTQDKIWIPSNEEIKIKNSQGEGVYYRALFDSNEDCVRMNNNAATDWALRNTQDINTLYIIDTVGSSTVTSTSNDLGIIIGFCT